MSILARYRKPGGFIQLLKLIETSQPVKQAKLLEVVEQEDPGMADLLRQKKITPEMALAWDPGHLVVVFENMVPGHLVCLFQHMGRESLKDYSTLFRPEKYREIKQLLDEKEENEVPSDGAVIAAKTHMLETIRFLDQEKKLRLNQIDPELDVSDAA